MKSREFTEEAKRRNELEEAAGRCRRSLARLRMPAIRGAQCFSSWQS